MAIFQILLLAMFAVSWNGMAQVVTTPTPNCAVPNISLSPANRQSILNRFNERRLQVLNGSLLLNNGKYALQPEQMPMLTWDDSLEAAAQEVVDSRCSNQTWSSLNETYFSAQNNCNSIDYYDDELPKSEPNYLNFLSNSTGPATLGNLRAQRILHDKATKVGCAIAKCTHPAYVPPIPMQLIQRPSTLLLCTFDFNLQLGTNIYNARTNASSSTTTIAPPITEAPTTPNCSSDNIDKTTALSLIDGKEIVVACGMLFGYIEAGFMDPMILDSPEFASHKTVLSGLGLLD